MKSLTVWHGHSTRPSLPAGTAKKGKENLPRGRRNRLISPAKKNRAFPTGNALLYISLSYVDFSGCVRQGAPFFLRCFLQFTNLQISDSIYATELSFTRKRVTTQQIRRMGFLIEKNKAFNHIFR